MFFCAFIIQQLQNGRYVMVGISEMYLKRFFFLFCAQSLSLSVVLRSKLIVSFVCIVCGICDEKMSCLYIAVSISEAMSFY